MESLKIKVVSSAQVKKVQDLLLKIGYFIGLESNIYFSNIDDCLTFLYTGQNGIIYFGTKYGKLDFNDLSAKEVTIQDLENMSEFKNKNKEWLIKDTDGKYWLATDELSLVGIAKENIIEVPEGAESLNYFGEKSNIFFLKTDRDKNLYSNSATDWEWSDWGDLNFDGVECLWLKKESIIDKLVDFPEFEHDEVNHPSHYCGHPSGIECIEITRHHDFAIGNAIKYLWRAGLKDSDNEIQDLEKAIWYIQDKIAQLKK